jgi:hypothetical protein
VNPFALVFGLIVVALLATGIFGIIAPSLDVELPEAPEFPVLTLNDSQDLLTQIWNILYFIGQIIWYFISYIGYTFLLMGTMVTVLSVGFIPPAVGSAVIILIGVLLVGSILYFLRGNQSK